MNRTGLGSWVLPGLLLAFASQPAGASAGTTWDVFAQIQSLQGQGRVREALALADASAEPLERAQARLFVLHHAGDLAGALSAGLAGLQDAPRDPWLLERSTTLALDLGAGELAGRLVERFDAAIQDPDKRAAWGSKWTELSERSRAATLQAAQVRTSLRRARWTTLGTGILALACLLALGRLRPGPAGPGSSPG